ncbi:bifunctional phosphopantothenoylcysteine decarboxylase/phosphopantothenate--cysteine ligase CoaBC [Porticoccaceae bacterium]|nr:bifunctional phosphopantothenoylcysteine decarboxylase/phosphopantothenate--cysteine ligase CoaBC [Porticoccaceae bacterium]MDA9583167.1 bifunctional phosphopantothenoylcysteine decarboxylase/phosphopantothenate--cysteine ligase CoaBC [Porticoccaceae bacterium]MDB2394982.1 bifunctional phosphopantothenoylcysteine decarboxylase/phosphopantothenate--cysteine ligase CoaBC [Porticoccaceae bacterium]MDB2399861.1 bifunctional phosphopantothenoylcysteine decarboxylase/phosphopantothenate--cysteine l
MCSLLNKRIILGVTGGIAAYKSAEVVRRLQDRGAEVRVVMTPGAEEFLRPLTMQALSGHPVHTGLLDEKAEAGMGHIELARWADLLLIAPASADFIANMVHGRADSLLAAIYLATPAKVAIAPAMNQAMWSHSASVENINNLTRRGVTIIGPESGSQACGDIGPGRMEQPDSIIEQASSLFNSGVLQGKKVVITAGPTREALDPVRYISNHSSGKMGYALAAAAIDAGADVTLISGPVALSIPEKCQGILVMSADEMQQAALEFAEGADIFIATAAVADYKAASIASEKIKSGDDKMTISLEKNPDIVSSVASTFEDLFVIGFAAESNDVETYAKGKLEQKHLDAIVANDISRTDIGFNSDDNEVSWIDTDSTIVFSKRSKAQLARDLVAQIAIKINSTHLDQ